MSYELRVKSYELRVMSYELRVYCFGDMEVRKYDNGTVSGIYSPRPLERGWG
jgi:hypothetical protein